MGHLSSSVAYGLVIHTLAIAGYRSIRSLVMPLEQITVVTGRNGTGKSSFYRALRLLADVAQGRVIGALAAEGGLQSTLWAGPEAFSRAMKAGAQPVQGVVRKGDVALRLGFASEDYGYAIDLGLPVAGAAAAFALDPEIKAEAVWVGDWLSRRNVIAERRGAGVVARGADGTMGQVLTALAPHDSMIMQAADPRALPELLMLRERMRAWRFYDHFRTDPEAPARTMRVGTFTPALAADGGDLAAALASIEAVGDSVALRAAVADAFEGGAIAIAGAGDGRLGVQMTQHGLLRPLEARELSDGTLRYLLLLAALLTPRPPGLIVLNEPETSLHPDLLAPLARLIAAASARCQIIVVTHAAALAEALVAEGALAHELSKDLGETVVGAVAHLRWEWPGR